MTAEVKQDEGDLATKPAPSRFGLRRLLQFRLRTLLLLTVAAAFYTQWRLRPQPETDTFGDYQVFHHLTTVPLPAGYGDGESQVEDGAYWITDKQGRLLVRGAYDKGVPCGKWRTYHLNGKLASVGVCDAETGGRTGVWKSFHSNGQLKQRVTYGKPRETTVELWQFGTQRVSVRDGPAQAWHANGEPYWRGQFKSDFPDGDWQYYDDQGQLMAAGSYRFGRRHMRWRTVGSDKTTRTVYYIFGRRTPDPQGVDDGQLDRWMEGDSEQRRLDAIHLAPHTNRWQWLAPYLMSAPTQQRLQILRTALLYEALAEPLLEGVKQAEQSETPTLRAAAIATRYSILSDQRPQLIKELAALPPALRRQVASELSVLNPHHFRKAMQTDDQDVSEFALQCLLCRWANRRNDYNLRTGVFSQGPEVRSVLWKADEDPKIPEHVRTLIAQWLHDTSPKGMQGGFF